MIDSNPYEFSFITWQGIELEIRFARDWLGSSKTAYPMAHIEVEAISPKLTALPITETGYRSHYCLHDRVFGIEYFRLQHILIWSTERRSN